ncbi:MAG: HAMP domain-containing protein [Anaerolineae bacterium]|nr:HAMP domain-containing protein [Anaerolineae bacterium]
MWYFTPASISYIAQFILALTIATYLAYPIKQQKKQGAGNLSSRLLSAFFFSLVAFSAMLFLNVTLSPRLRLYALYLETPVIALSFLLLLQFAYRFPSLKPRQVWEAWIMFGLTAAYFLFEAGFAIYRFWLLAHQHIDWRPEFADVPMVIFTIWLMVVLTRQGIQSSNEITPQVWWRALLKPVGVPARTTRAFTIIFSSFLLLSAMEFARAYKIVPGEIRELIFSIGLLLALFAFALVYINAVPETTSFMTKLVGISLVTILVIIGALGWLIFPAVLDSVAADNLLPDQETLRFSPNAAGGYDIATDDFTYQEDLGSRLDFPEAEQPVRVDLDFSFPFYGNRYDHVYVLKDGTISLGEPLAWKDVLTIYGPSPAIFAFFSNFPLGASDDGVFVSNEPDTLVFTWNQMRSRSDGHLTVQVKLYPDGVFDITYVDTDLRAADIYSSSDMSGVVGVMPGGSRSDIDHISLAASLPYSGSKDTAVVDNLFLRVRSEIHRVYLPLAGLIVLSSLLVIVGFPAFFRDTLINPLNTLLDGVRRVNNGDLELTMPVKHRDEIGFLTTSFNDMMVELRTLVTDLEQRVVERTQQLELQTIDLARQIEERNQLISELDAFAHTVAHDLKNPLANVFGFSELALAYYRDGDIDEVHMCLENIARYSVKMTDIIESLLMLATLRKEDAIETTPVDMTGVVDEVLLRLETMIEQSGAELVLPEKWPPAIGHHLWIEEVWANYISNAIKYGGQPPRIELGADQPVRGLVRFWIRDNGDGLSVEQQELVFTPFTRLHKLKAEGHGLGLSIVQRIVEKLGGSVGVESQPGSGSTFTFTLPADG